jgi:hypothetical protein
MTLQDGATYRAPDGRLYRAKRQTRRYAPGYTWTMVPPHLDTHRAPRLNYIEEYLFEEGGKLYRSDRHAIPINLRDTGWTLDYLVHGLC